MKRVVVSGAGAVTALGAERGAILSALQEGRSGLQLIDEWKEVKGLRSRVGGVVAERGYEARYDRKKTRSMTPASLMAVRSSELALQDASLLTSEGAYFDEAARRLIQTGQAGVAFGSCMAGPNALMQIAVASADKNLTGIPATNYTKVMSHVCAANVSMFFGLRGRLIPTCSACTSGSQAIGFAYESIRAGCQTLMVAGGAEELCIGLVGLFDSMNATSAEDVNPAHACRPFAEGRDGLALAEGSCSLILEELEHAEARGARILAEVVGFGTNSNGAHVTNPDPEPMAEALRLALSSAQLHPRDIGFVHAHATATDLGDVAEARAMLSVFGEGARVGGLKSYFGHTLGAAGALEAWLSIEMMRRGEFFPIRNLQTIDPRCAGLDYLQGSPRQVSCGHVMNNNFAFGGVNTSLVFKAWGR